MNTDERNMKRCYELAVQAGRKGFDTFGAVLVHDGEILEEAENTADWDKGIFGHAEFNLVHKCANRYSDAVLKESTLYTSCAPCERCLCAIASLGVENVVFGVSYEAFSQLTPGDAVPVDREGLLRKLGIRMKLTGPVLEEEGMHVFEWWGGEYRPLEELIAEMAEIKAADKTGKDHVILRSVTEKDLPEVARTWPSDHRPVSEEEARGAIAYMRDNDAKNTKGCIFHLCLAVCRAEDPDTIMGWCGLDGRRNHTEPEIFILLDEAYRNQGYGTQCVKELLRMAAEEYGLPGVHGGCDKDNIASRRAMEKGGMVQYGTEDNGDPLFRFTVKEKN